MQSGIERRKNTSRKNMFLYIYKIYRYIYVEACVRVWINIVSVLFLGAVRCLPSISLVFPVVLSQVSSASCPCNFFPPISFWPLSASLLYLIKISPLSTSDHSFFHMAIPCQFALYFFYNRSLNAPSMFHFFIKYASTCIRLTF